MDELLLISKPIIVLVMDEQQQ